MYENFFGFREKPFKLIPNPAYLFLSWSHEEALAHLTYAVSQGDGFLAVTGEVGTGKTTLCRSFLEGLDEQTEAAFIFNPKLDAVRLLKAVNDEFGINADVDDTKELIDALNVFLLDQKAKGKNVILLIDEAQNLSRDALEQLRLLSNFETTRHKLLQIILVGQPELGNMLDAHELRQLGQRVALRSHLSPLTPKETREYIQHRIHIASMKSAVTFSRSAYRRICQYSGGVPRLINIVCERALITAFGMNRHKISGGVVKTAIRELPGGDRDHRPGLKRIGQLIFTGSALFMVLASLFLIFTGIINIQVLLDPPGSQPPKTFFSVPPASNIASNIASSAEPATPEKQPVQKPSSEQKPYVAVGTPVEKSSGATASNPKAQPEPAESPPEKSIPAAEPPDKQPLDEKVALEPPAKKATYSEEPVAASDTVSDKKTSGVALVETLNGLAPRASRQTSLKAVMGMWGTTPVMMPDFDHLDDTEAYFNLAAEQNGMLIRYLVGDLVLVKSLNMPAILECYPPGRSSPVYLALTGIEHDRLILVAGQDTLSVSPEDLDAFWSGIVYLPWKNFLNISGTIPLTAENDAIITLKILLRDIGFDTIDIRPVYDEPTREAVEGVQKKYGIDVDGVVGSTTKIALYKERKAFVIPSIVDNAIQAAEN